VNDGSRPSHSITIDHQLKSAHRDERAYAWLAELAVRPTQLALLIHIPEFPATVDNLLSEKLFEPGEPLNVASPGKAI
jgi:hypothetical protein